MKIYQIDSSARKKGSTSRALAKKVLEKIKKPGDEVIYRDLDDEMVFVSGLTESGMKIDEKDQTEEHKKIILYGSGSQSIDFSKIKGRRGWTSKKKPFEGIIPRMIRRYEESDIRSVREDLSRYVISKPCLSCQGDRLNSSARNVFIDNNNIFPSYFATGL